MILKFVKTTIVKCNKCKKKPLSLLQIMYTVKMNVFFLFLSNIFFCVDCHLTNFFPFFTPKCIENNHNNCASFFLSTNIPLSFFSPVYVHRHVYTIFLSNAHTKKTRFQICMRIVGLPMFHPYIEHFGVSFLNFFCDF